MNIPVGIIKFHRELLLTCRIFFVKKIPLFLTLSRKIYFMAVNHLANCTVLEIIKAFKELYKHYLHCGFHIATVHADGEFGPFKSLIEFLPVVPLVNMDASNEHVPDIKRKIRVAKERYRATRHGLPGVESEDILHRSQSPSKLYSPGYIQRFQGVISVLPTPWLPHHYSACRQIVRAFKDPDRVPTMGVLVNLAAANELVPDI